MLKLIIESGDDLKWEPFFESGDIFEAKTSPQFFLGIPAQQITILFNYDTVMINCIYDLNRRGSVDILGRNKNVVDALIDSIKNAEKAKVL